MFAIVAATGLVVGLILGGVAWASVPSSGGVISTCYSKATGTWRPIDKEAGAKCKSGETQLDLYTKAQVDTLLANLNFLTQAQGDARYQPAATHHTLTIYEDLNSGVCQGGATQGCEGFLGYDNPDLTGSPISTNHGSFVSTGAGGYPYEATYTYSLAGGDITVSGYDPTLAGPFDIAVVGGTGDYAGASGTSNWSCLSNVCTYTFDFTTP